MNKQEFFESLDKQNDRLAVKRRLRGLEFSGSQINWAGEWLEETREKSRLEDKKIAKSTKTAAWLAAISSLVAVGFSLFALFN